MTRGNKKQRDDPVRYRVIFPPEATVADRVVPASLAIIESMYERATRTNEPGHARPPIAVTGRAVIEIMSGRGGEVPPTPTLLAAHGTPEAFLHHLRARAHHDRLAEQQALEIVGAATYLRLPAAAFNRPATDAPRTDGVPVHRFARGMAVLNHAAMRAATVSLVRVRHAGHDVQVMDVPMLTPAGIILTELGRLGRAAGMVRELRTALKERDAELSNEQHAEGKRLLRIHDDQLIRIGRESATLLPRAIHQFGYTGNDHLRSITDDVFADPDVEELLTLGLGARDAFGMPYLGSTTRTDCEMTMRSIRTTAQEISAGLPPKALRGTTPRQSPPGR
jgi:hypothetical protein